MATDRASDVRAGRPARPPRAAGRGRAGALLAAVAAACAPGSEAPTTTVALALEAPPARVVSLAASVYDVERARIAASATIAAARTELLLGVPAETPIELRVVARTAAPGPAALGGMPAFYGAVRRTIPLGRDLERVALTVRPAGVLTVEGALPPGVEADDEFPLRLEGLSLAQDGASAGATAGELPARFSLAPGDPDRPRRARSLVLRGGRWGAALDVEAPEDDDPAVLGGQGVWVEPEVETVARLVLVPEPAAPGAAARLALALLERAGAPLEPPDVVPLGGAGPRLLSLRVGALDAAGRPMVAPLRATVTLVAESEPAAGVLAAPLSGAERALTLPATAAELAVVARGRLRLVARARLEDGRTVHGVLAVNALGPAEVPGGVARVRLGVVDPAALETGTACTVELLDAEGLYAQGAEGTVDLAASDPWIVLGAGSSWPVGPGQRGLLRAPLARPSQRRGVPAVLRVEFHAPGAPTRTASIALPLLEVHP